jgi:hypothetical protein
MRALRQTLPRLLRAAALAALILIALAPAAHPAAAASGIRLVKTPARDQVWLLAEGHRQWVADLATFRARGYRWSEVETVAPAVLHALPVRAADHLGPLLSDTASGDVYLVADGQARLVPDLVSFGAVGLDWRRVEPATPAALSRHTRGPPLPHAVAGRPFPELPATTPPGSRTPAAAAAAAGPDPRLRAALDLVAAYPPTAGWPAFLRERGVATRFGTVTGGHASYNAADRTLTVAEAVQDGGPRALAALLVHETVHAIYDARGSTGQSGQACIDEEAHAFAVQSAFWAHQHGLAGAPSPSSVVEQELNSALQWARDDALFGKMLTTWAYTLRCYFPSAGPSPEE